MEEVVQRGSRSVGEREDYRSLVGARLGADLAHVPRQAIRNFRVSLMRSLYVCLIVFGSNDEMSSTRFQRNEPTNPCNRCAYARFGVCLSHTPRQQFPSFHSLPHLD